MATSPAFRGLACTDCGVTHPLAEASHRCPDCGGLLDADYDTDADAAAADLEPGHAAGVGRYADLLPFPADALVSIGEGGTPLVACPGLADDLGVGRVLVKDEGRNPTGSVRDRGLALAVTAAVEAGATDVALPTTGNGGQAAAAYAARAGLDAHAYVPARAAFVNKAMINVHGGDMSVGDGRYDDSARVFADEAEEGWYSVAAFETPFRHEGHKTLAYELAAQLDWTAPDAVVHPTGHGTGIVGLGKGMCELDAFGLLAGTPELYAAQAAGCAPIVEAVEEGRDEHEVWDVPDTICGGLEVADPVGSPLVLDALRESGGGAVAAEDRALLESAVDVAGSEGIELGAAGGAGVSAARALAERGDLDSDDTVVLVNPAAGSKDDDVLRSHLMSKGV